ncbi:type VI secretion system ATPase TssH [Paracoccus sp. MC1862]|uniref:type VI secretion system ATPase TssH n=1 Tax=Paracoccus sp. MC1862 TaxID=2760307 RepID=UPI0016030042|nr:type VI secretion system ATPase TssH [Paracoccus sp. MC1862]MBB1499062.1 type VI secretion system ATPase TssH [Paracoccus sp. MC1862]QQO46063.1 type VI secretion system ATPase TssH [Paracoccus sp. MC1862]
MTTVTPRILPPGSRETVKRKELVGRLNPLCLRAFSDAARKAKSRGNPYVELAHFIAALAERQDSDLALIGAAAGVDAARLEGDLARALDALPRGASAVEEFSDHIFHAIQEGWTRAALERGTDQVRSADILIACLKTPALESLLLRISPELGRIDADLMAPDLPGIVAASGEAEPPALATAEPVAARQADGALAKYATNLTERARAGRIDPVVGRDPEIRQIIDILMRRRQNNPILTGEAGVGKTAVVEGFAQRLARGDVPPQLASVDLWLLDIGLMQAGASVKGEFEKRLKAVIDDVQSSVRPVILFIDEAHTLIGAGGAAGTGDAANLLKPALARGELRTVAATTWAEYKQHIEKDPALTRRFQVVRIEEPSEAAAIEMLRGMAGVLEAHHRVEILDEAIGAAVALSHRYIPARQLPDKAISLLDTACARVAVSQHATPAELEDLQRRLQALEIEAGIIARETAVGVDTAKRQAANDAARVAAEADRDAAVERWKAEKALVADILRLRAELRGEGVALDGVTPEQRADGSEAGGEKAGVPPDASPAPLPTEDPGLDGQGATSPDPAARLADLRAKMSELAGRQGERPLILPSVDRLAVGAIVQDWTGIPVGRMLASQTERALGLAALLAERVVGQDHAMEAIASRVQTGLAGLGAPEKPVGVFMLCGPSGVGKTETALALADALYGGEQNLISINMSEFQEAHTVSTLKGAPPGYVGYGKGGVLTEAVRRRPYAVILLDEVEKAHPDVHEIFFQVFDKGSLDDSEGRRIDFRNTLILMTSNVGTDEIMALTDAGHAPVRFDQMAAALRPPLLKVFPPALLGRLVTVPYLPLSDAMIETIASHKLRAIARRLHEAHGAELVVGDGVMAQIRARCTEVESGGRMIDAILTGTLLPELSRRVLEARLEGLGIARVTVTGGTDGFAYDLG